MQSFNGIVGSSGTTVTFTIDSNYIDVINVDGGAPIWFTVNDGMPTLTGSPAYGSNNSYCAATAGSTVRLNDTGNSGATIKMIATTNTMFSVIAV